ncbi:uncharacterized protein MONOS_933 [Monocercomonoides exilis]|uniref:uncharacterized protein n=1 Tax=Monocercomonoides exilis TaxID=2049356 RepID=UPI0035599E06|nr:hypothetical protein MONOS_933 [Monocercomonoides exilis]
MSSYFSSVPRFMPFPLSTATQSSFYNVPGSMSTLSFNSFANEKKPSSPDISMARAQNQKSSAPFPSTYNPSILNFSAFSPSEPKFATSEQLSSHNSSSFSPSQLDIDAVTLKNDDTKMEKEIEMEREKEVEIEKEKEKEKEKENENENEMTLQSNSIKLLPSVPSSVFSASSSLSGPSINSSPSSAVVPSSLSLPHSDRIVGKPLTPTSIENFSFLPPPPFSHQHPSNQTPPQPSASSAPSSTTSNFASISARPVSSDVLSIQTRQNSVTSANASEGPSNNSPSSVSNSAFQPFQLLLTPPPSLPLPPPPLPQNKELAVNNKIESDVSTEENDLTIRKCHLTQKVC